MSPEQVAGVEALAWASILESWFDETGVGAWAHFEDEDVTLLRSKFHAAGWQLTPVATLRAAIEAMSTVVERDNYTDPPRLPDAGTEALAAARDELARAALAPRPQAGWQLTRVRLASAIEETPARALAVLMEQLPDESQGAAAAVLFIVLPGEMSDEERAAHIERGRQLVAEHPEWLAPQAPSNVRGLPGFGEGMERARQDFEAGRVEPVHTRLKHEHSK